MCEVWYAPQSTRSSRSPNDERGGGLAAGFRQKCLLDLADGDPGLDLARYSRDEFL